MLNRRLTTVLLLTAGLAVVFALAQSARIQAGVENVRKQALADEGRKSPSILMQQARAIFGRLPSRMPGSESDTPEMIALGGRLYVEDNISVNKTQSCNDCHHLDDDRGGVVNTVTAEGAEGIFGPRNAPTVLNAGFQISQFWDGRADDLKAQAKGPPLNPIEMGMPDIQAIDQRLQNLEYAGMFAEAFATDSKPVSFDNMARAIAAYERTLITRGRFDDFIDGDENALSDKEKQGLSTFMNEGCIRCHSGPVVGGMLYQKIGMFHPYSDREDLGRYDVTHKESDKYVFKVPMLRNVTLTAPYFHDGKIATLAEAVDLMSWLQLDTKLSDEQINNILRFMTTLADKQRVTKPAPDWQQANWTPPNLAAIPESDSAESIRYGKELLSNTYSTIGPGAAQKAMRYSGNGLACVNCHQETGTQPWGNTWVGVTNRYPQYRSRSGGMGTIQDRINGCLQRSMNGRRLPENSRQMQAIVAYMDWLGKDAPADMSAVGIHKSTLYSRTANLAAGEQRYNVACQTCHGMDGSGYRSMSSTPSGGYVVPPLWGPDSYNNGAGMNRILTTAGFMRANMPLGTTWHQPMLTEDEAFDVAGYVNSHERPTVEGLEDDYPDLKQKPVDCPYPPYADNFPQSQHKYGPFQPIIDARKE